MNLHEYQAKQLFSQYQIPVPPSKVISDIAELEQLPDQAWVVKAQVHSGGRGKAGGVKLAKNLAETIDFSQQLLGTELITPQSGGKGLPIDKLLLEPLSDIAQEFYLSLLIDRSQARLVMIASKAGGMDIETVAEQQPEAIFQQTIDPISGLQAYQTRQLAFALGLADKAINQFTHIGLALYRLFLDTDASLIEINPLVLSKDLQLLALDAKINLDDNALYRHPKLIELRDLRQEDAREALAKQYQLNYITLEGNIACMVNGAGLAMATMDLVKRQGGLPANFLDVGGGTNADRVAEAFKLIVSDSQVKAILVNIFGGIVRCDLIAQGIIQAMQEIKLDLPVVVRLEGTNAKQGQQMLADSGLKITATQDLSTASQQVVALAKGTDRIK